MSLHAGTRLGAYEIRSVVGAGGMGEVYRAWDPRLRRNVAVKVLHASLNVNPDRLRRFEEEARATAALNHSNIVTVYDVGSHQGKPYIVSELLEGETLRSILARGAVPTKTVIAFAIQLCQGLAAAHEKGIIHRDLKPENLFITRDQHLKILDFGLAKLLDRRVVSENGTTTLDTAPGVIMGTVGYLSPEQVKGEQADRRSDIFGFGVILYEMLAGVRPFQGEEAIDVLHAILRQPPPPLSISNDRLGKVLTSIVGRCLEKEPTERFQTARAILSTLHGHVIVAIDPAPPYQDDDDVVAYREPPGWITWSGPVLLALLVVGISSLVVWSKLPYYVRGCLTSPTRNTFVLIGSRSPNYVVNASALHDLRQHVGHEVEISYTRLFSGSSGPGQIDISGIRTIAPTCK